MPFATAGNTAAAQRRAMAGILRETSDRYFVIIIGQTYRARTHKASRPAEAERTGRVRGRKLALYTWMLCLGEWPCAV
jgi:hypothetical protein